MAKISSLSIDVGARLEDLSAQFRSLDMKQPGQWPLLPKLAVWLLATALVVVLAWVLMLAWSKPWLDRFRYGPLEWLWRCLTYRRVFALRK